MAILKFDSRSLKMELVVGIEEEWKPKKEIKQIADKLDKLKKETQDYIKSKEKWKDKSLVDLVQFFQENEDEKKKWQKYLESTYNIKVAELVKEIKEINKTICPGFREELDKMEETKE